jgi:hypothetical protein
MSEDVMSTGLCSEYLKKKYLQDCGQNNWKLNMHRAVVEYVTERGELEDWGVDGMI